MANAMRGMRLAVKMFPTKAAKLVIEVAMIALDAFLKV